jgi:hypothetical protein
VRLRERSPSSRSSSTKARAAGRPTEELGGRRSPTQKQWLAQAGGSVEAPVAAASKQPEAPKKPKSTSGWVRADG